ncbi:hypothetical protein, partial [Bacillus cereus]
SLFQVVLLGQDEVLGFLSLASVLPVLKVKQLKFPISVIDHITDNGNGHLRKGVIVGTDNGRLSLDMFYLCINPEYRSISIFDSKGFNQELKKDVYLIKRDLCIGRTNEQITELAQSFLNTAMTKELKETIDNKIAVKAASKEADKAAKQATKATKGKPVNSIAEQVA